MAETRVYFVIDARSFYASVEAADRGLDPLGVDLVVADASRTEKTICLAVSPSLKAKGVKNRCRLFDVPKDPNIVIAKPRMKRYIEIAAGIYGIYLKYISKDDIHVYSIDESILDVTTYLKLYNIRAKDFALKLMDEIKQTYGIPTTAGIGTNMYLAKVASGLMAKHDPQGVGWLNEEKFLKVCSNHRPITDFWMTSVGTATRLAKLGIYDMEGIRKADENVLYKEFGINAELLIDHAYGREPTRMIDIKLYKSQSRGVTTNQILPCAYSFSDAKVILKEMIESACLDLARKGYVSSRLGVAISYDGHYGRQRKPDVHYYVDISGKGNLANLFMPIALEQYEKRTDRKLGIKAIAVGFSDVREEAAESFSLFDDTDEITKQKNLRDSLLLIEEKFGKNAVLKGVDFTKNATRRERNMMIGGHMGGDE